MCSEGVLTCDYRNIAKTKFMVFHFHIHKRAVSYPGNTIECVMLLKFLGLILQSSLSWNKHVNHISLKVSKTIGIIGTLLKVFLTLFNTLLLPHFNYCMVSLGSVFRENH